MVMSALSDDADECGYAICKLQEYLRIPTVQPQPAYEQCTRFLLEVWVRARTHVHEMNVWWTLSM